MTMEPRFSTPASTHVVPGSAGSLSIRTALLGVAAA
jgi:hypothetical protein